MKEILKILKPLTIPILIAILFLFFQARLELKLPDYTANIVNTGIQQNGIEKAIYKEVSTDTMNHLLLFTEKDDEILSYYHTDKDLYVLNKDVSDIDKLEKLLSDPIYIVGAFDSLNGKTIKESNIEGPINSEALYLYISSLTKEEFEQDFGKFIESMTSVNDSLKKQANISYIVKEYKNIGYNINKTQMNYLLKSGLKMLLIAFILMLIAIGVSYLSSVISAKFSCRLREKLVKRIMTFSKKESEEFSTASLITRTTNDVQQVQMFLLFLLRIVIFAPIMGFGALAKVSGSSLAWLIGLAVLSILVVIILLFAIALPKFKIIQKIIDKVNLISREIIFGIPVIRAFSNEKHEEKRFDKANKDLMNINLFVNKVMVFMMPFMSFVMNTIAVGIIWFGSKSVDAGTLQVGDLMALITYSIQIIISFIMISIVSIILPRAIVSFKRIVEVLNKETSIKDIDNPKKLKKNEDLTVRFNDVSFMYHDAHENVIEDVTFEAKPNTVTAIIGSTGCGKSSLINLIPRFFDVTKGSITINDIDIKELSLHNLRENIGYVPQKGFLFTGTIESNIKFSDKKISNDDMIEAAKIAQATEFINKKENKYKEEISEGGTNVSGGQKQRLAIARALAFKPKILIFDDSFSAVDYKTDSKLRSSLKKNLKGTTTFIVAQRISTVLDADQIIVLEKGKVVGIGKHKDLMKSCEVYKEIALSQLSEEELA